MKKRLAAVALLIGILCMAFGDLTAVAQTTGGSTKAVANVVLLAKFAGDTDTLFDQPKTREDLYDLYNGSRPRSFASYLRTVSYGQLEVKTVFPQDNGDKFIPYTLHVTREQAQAADIDVDILQDILQNVPIDSSLLVDGDGDGVVDNLTVLMQGAGGDRGEGITTTVSHKANYPGVLTVAGGKQVSAYNMVMSDQVYDGAMTSSTGTIIHEFLHTMGYPDLYASDGTAYVGQWDIMASTSTFVQWPLAYLRQAISGWIDVETLTTTQEITLDEQSDAGGTQAYILRAPLSATEFFVVEYRRQGDDIASSLDYKIGGSGIIVYRVNTSVEGLSNFHGANGVYVFRAQSGYDTEALALYRGAHLSAESGRTSIGTSDMGKSLADGALTFSDGTNSGIVISEVGSAGGSSITATVTFPEIDQKDIWTPVFSGSEPADRTSVIAADGALYAASCQYGGSIAVQRFDGTSWSSLGTPGKGDAPQCAVYGGQLYIAFRDQSSGTVKVKRYTGTSFTEVGFGVGGVNSFDLYGDADGLYLAYDVDSQSMHLAVYDPGLQSFKSDGSPVFTGLCGQPQVQSINGTVYVQLRSAAGASQLATFSRQADGSYCEAGDRQAGDMMASCAGDGSLYRAFRDQSAVYVQHFDGTVWQTVGAPIRAQNVMDIGITCHAGQPYVAFSDAGADKTLVYTANSQNDWYQFGLPVDAASGEIDLAVLGNTVYAGYSLSAKQQFQIKEKSAAVQASGITVVPPAKLEYKVGEAADYTGMKVSLQRIGAGDVEVPLGSCTITGFDTSAAGQKTVTVTYLGYQSTFAITVHARTAVSLQVSSAEPIVLYQGQTADISRLKVAVMYGDGSSEELPIASCQVSGYDSITVGPRQGTVAYQGVTGQFSYLVKANLLERIEASPTSGALHFAYGAKFDDTRIRVIGHYSNGSTQVIAAGRYTISGFSSKIAGDHTLTISCGGKTTTLSYRIDQPPAFQITSGSASSSTVDPANGGSLTCKFTINRAATCAVQVWSTTGFVGYASGNRSFPAGSSTVSWAVPRDLKDGKYSFRVVSVQNGREVDRWIDFTAKSTPFSITGGSTSTSTVDPSQGGSLTCKFTINRAATCAVQVWSTTGFVGYASGNRSFPAGSSTVSWTVPRDLKDGKYSFRVVSVQDGREVDRWIDFTAKR
ncbi:bacterial Ig-like domain-containing protein [Neobittarella massiliensis]|uniref:bacterial Ig-like domain-containing protein n=1 Tax=Neobittarella massiliensis (ex Bilen et al. 2018) TaxID=2041842 RepID=UPI000CF5FCC3|nr:bacterial Ig-like domain-containing protein [Neobittarella massiliensis]